jgi:hypothetical protein
LIKRPIRKGWAFFIEMRKDKILFKMERRFYREEAKNAKKGFDLRRKRLSKASREGPRH